MLSQTGPRSGVFARQVAAFLVALTLCVVPEVEARQSSAAAARAADPLPSWNDGTAKKTILDFVERVTTPGSPDFVPVSERIAVFDNDGTLWQEKPVVQGAFVLERLKRMVAKDPSLAQKPPFKAALENDLAYFLEAGEEEVMKILSSTHGDLTREQFDEEAREFFRTAKHPKFGVPYTQLGYQPMVELLRFLRAKGFQTWICSGGGMDFMRVVSEEMYGIPPEQVIGSSLKESFEQRDGQDVIVRKSSVERINDKKGKPVGIDLHIGRRPVFAAGNVRSGGDIAMLEYTGERKGASLQLLINHDDPEREFAYQEKKGESLEAARANGWTVVSIRDDWKNVFDLSR